LFVFVLCRPYGTSVQPVSTGFRHLWRDRRAKRCHARHSRWRTTGAEAWHDV